MKTIGIIVLLAGIAGTLLFSAFLMLHPDGADSHAICLPNLVRTEECKDGAAPFVYLRTHLGSLTGLTAPAFQLAAFALVALWLALRFSPTVRRRDHLVLTPAIDPASGALGQTLDEKLLAWFAIHEKRDPLAVLRP